MKDGLLHDAQISSDVAAFNGVNTCAQGCGGGFPCQVSHSDLPFFCGSTRFVFTLWDGPCNYVCSVAAKGVSSAGAQGGLSDKRTGLLRYVFQCFDQLESPLLGVGKQCQSSEIEVCAVFVWWLKTVNTVAP